MQGVTKNFQSDDSEIIRNMKQLLILKHFIYENCAHNFVTDKTWFKKGFLFNKLKKNLMFDNFQVEIFLNLRDVCNRYEKKLRSIFDPWSEMYI